jgi:hypothetical protein
MAAIIPRWEWRVFGEGFGAAEAALAASTPESVEESDERYLLSVGGANVKVRAGLVDIKLLREVDAGGLERWEPSAAAGPRPPTCRPTDGTRGRSPSSRRTPPPSSPPSGALASTPPSTPATRGALPRSSTPGPHATR